MSGYSEELVAFVKAWEGLKLRASRDPLVDGVVDIGYGHVLHKAERLDVITCAQADALLRCDLNDRALALDDALGGTPFMPAQHEFDALLSFAYNLGVAALATSTLMRRVREGNPFAAANEFGRWVRAGGRIVPGLVKRRAAERAMFENVDYSLRP